MWRDLLSGRRRRPESRSAVATTADVWERAGQIATATLPLMAEIEGLALKIYANHGLPILPGHYRRNPSAETWEYLGEHVEADLRWFMVLEKPPENGWRYATLEDIGRYPGAPADLRAASNLLATCRRLKSRLAGREPGNPGDDIETAIRLGSEWRALQGNLARRDGTRLKLTAPIDCALDSAPVPKPKANRKRRKPAA